MTYLQILLERELQELADRLFKLDVENKRLKKALEKATAALEVYGDITSWTTQYISGGLTGECFNTPDTFGCDNALAEIEAILKGEK